MSRKEKFDELTRKNAEALKGGGDKRIEQQHAKQKLTEMEAEIPDADPVAIARMKYEQENTTQKGMMGKAWAPFSKSPDVTQAAKSGQPTMTTLRPSLPVSIPLPAGAAGGVTDVTVSTQTPGSSTALETQPDARMNQPAQGTAQAQGSPDQQAVSAQNEPLPTNRQAPPPKKGKTPKNKTQEKK